jgi:hypothetical protein
MLPAKQRTPPAVKKVREGLADTPGMAQMLSVDALQLGHPFGYINQQQPFEHVSNLDMPDRGHMPWPQWAVAPSSLVSWTFFAASAWAYDVPARLRPLPAGALASGVAPWPRNGDLVPAKEDTAPVQGGVHPLRTADALELDRCAITPIMFENSCWKSPGRSTTQIPISTRRAVGRTRRRLSALSSLPRQPGQQGDRQAEEEVIGWRSGSRNISGRSIRTT